MKFLDVVCLLLLIIGGLNWGSVGVADYNFVEAFFGVDTMSTKSIYALVGLAALYRVFQCKSIRERWSTHKD